MTVTEDSPDPPDAVKVAQPRHMRLTPWLAPRRWVWLRILCGLTFGISLLIVAYIAFFVGAVIASGCGFAHDCESLNPAIGVPILVLAATVFVLSLASFWWGVHDANWRTFGRALTILWVLVVGLMMALAIYWFRNPIY